MAEQEYVAFGTVVRDRPRMGLPECQSAVRYLFGSSGYPNIGAGLRFTGEPDDYRNVTIHREDVEEFVRRLLAFKKDGLLPQSPEKRLAAKAAFRGIE